MRSARANAHGLGAARHRAEKSNHQFAQGICPIHPFLRPCLLQVASDKISTTKWLSVIGQAHRSALPTTSIIMLGQLERYEHWGIHLMRLRRQQKDFGGFTEFVPLPFVHMEAPMYLRGRARRGPTLREAILMHAVARLVLHPHIVNIQVSWTKMGPDWARRSLEAGANDLGGTLMNESISRAAGAVHGQELSPQRIADLIIGWGESHCNEPRFITLHRKAACKLR